MFETTIEKSANWCLWDNIRTFFFSSSQDTKVGCLLQSELERQHLEAEVCRLEKEVTSLEEAHRDLDNRQVASDQTLQSHNAIIADLRLQLDKERVRFGMHHWDLKSAGFFLVRNGGCSEVGSQNMDRRYGWDCSSVQESGVENVADSWISTDAFGHVEQSGKLSWILRQWSMNPRICEC